MATHWTLGCDAADPQRLAAFWARALRYVPEPGFDGPDNASIIDPDGLGPAIGFGRVPEGKTAKNRVHIDIRVAGEPPWDPVERERLVREHTGFAIGGVAPVGHPTHLRTIIDVTLGRYATVWAAAGHSHSVFATTYDELIRITGGQPMDVA